MAVWILRRPLSARWTRPGAHASPWPDERLPFLECRSFPTDDSLGRQGRQLLDILVIDDSAFIRAFARIHLQEAGYEAGEVDPTSLFEVLNAIHTHRPALVLTDYEMPFCNGETLIRAIREDTAIQDIPILVLSAHRESDLVERLSQWDLAGYVVKPIKPEDLVTAVRKCLPRQLG